VKPPSQPFRRSVHIAANWKLNQSRAEAAAWMREFVAHLRQGWDELSPESARLLQTFRILIFPTLTLIEPLQEMARRARIELGAQDVSRFERGAYTGEVAAWQVREVGAVWALVGHSERRRIFGESDEVVAEKLGRVLDAGLRGMLLVGETLKEREAGRTEEVLRRQLSTALEGVEPADAIRLALAYEPVWAVGTGRNADPELVREAAAFIRGVLEEILGEDARFVPLLYGGSVNPENLLGYLVLEQLDGALIGGASLDPGDFWEMVKLGAAVHLRRFQG